MKRRDIIPNTIKSDARDRPCDHPATCLCGKVPKSDRWCDKYRVKLASVGDGCCFFCRIILIFPNEKEPNF